MHDPKFEKEVQQKMEGLEFAPPEAVWLKVERAVNQTRRRRLPVFWLFFFAGIALVASGGIILAIRRNGPVALTNISINSGNNVNSAHPAIAANPPAGLSDKDKPSALQGTTDANATGVTAKTAGSTGNAMQGIGKAAGDTDNSTKRTDKSTKGTDKSTERSALETKEGSVIATTEAGKTTKETGRTKPGGIYAQTGPGNSTNNLNTPLDNNTVSTNSLNSSNNSRAKTSGKVKTGGLIPIPAGIRGDIASLYRNRPSSSTGLKGMDRKLPAIQKLQTNPKHSWEAGFAGGVGTSSMNQTLFQKTTINALAVRQSAGTSVTAFGAAPPPKVSTSRIQPDISFWAGIMVQKQISNKFTIAGGLNLHYYSTRLRTGDKVVTDPNSLTANSYFTPASLAAAPLPATPYYPVGNEQVYMNRYYFLELPVSVQWRINKSNLLPLFWEGGLSVSYLMSSDALYYNTADAVYYKDGAMANRTQLNASTAFLVGLPIRGIRIQAGPQIQYGLTRVLNEGTAGDGHMFFAGIKLVVLPGKRK